MDEAAKIKNTDIVNELKLPPVKIHCSVLAEDAIKAALAGLQGEVDDGGSAGGGRRASVRDEEAHGHGTGADGDARRSRSRSSWRAEAARTSILRMGVKGGGCSGLSYSLEFDSEIGQHDKKFDIDGVQVVCDTKSYLYLNGITLDYVTQGLTGGFTFVNPQAKSSCGCGTSFSA